MIDINNFKVVTEKTYNKRNEVNGANFIINGICVCTIRKYLEQFCSAKSNLRDTTKTAKETRWNLDNIGILTGLENARNYRDYFRNYSPNTNYLTTLGAFVSAHEVKDLIIGFVNSNTIEKKVVAQIASPEKTKQVLKMLNDLMRLNEAHGHDVNEKICFPENFNIYNKNANAPITGAQSACYDNALTFSKKNKVPLCIGAFIDKKQLLDDIEWVNKTDFNKFNQYFAIYPHAWNLNTEGEIFDITIYNDLEEYFYIGIEVDCNKFKTGFGDLNKYLRTLLNTNIDTDKNLNQNLNQNSIDDNLSVTDTYIPESRLKFTKNLNQEKNTNGELYTTETYSPQSKIDYIATTNSTPLYED
jgi:hypothetical protein